MKMECSLFVLYERDTRSVCGSFTNYFSAMKELERRGRGYIVIEYGLVSDVEIIHSPP